MSFRSIRGAITVENDNRSEILRATRQLLALMVARNAVDLSDICDVLFSMTPDLKSVYPAEAARQMEWVDVPMLCVQEQPITGSLARCIRVLLRWNTEKPQSEVKHVYLNNAEKLRGPVPALSEEDRTEVDRWLSDPAT